MTVLLAISLVLKLKVHCSSSNFNTLLSLKNVELHKALTKKKSFKSDSFFHKYIMIS